MKNQRKMHTSIDYISRKEKRCIVDVVWLLASVSDSHAAGPGFNPRPLELVESDRV